MVTPYEEKCLDKIGKTAANAVYKSGDLTIQNYLSENRSKVDLTNPMNVSEIGLSINFVGVSIQ